VDLASSPVLSEVLQATAGLYETAGFAPPWICYLAFRDGANVGTCGFKAAPVEGRVEIAYFTFPPFEGQGIATAMASELLAIAASADPSVRVTARTLPQRNASHRVLEKLGFRSAEMVQDPEDGTVLEWRLDTG
jgi:RimJ/RimL family protein N-acetyltransferase